MRKEEERRSDKFPALCLASKHVGHIWAKRKRREGESEDLGREGDYGEGENVWK